MRCRTSGSDTHQNMFRRRITNRSCDSRPN